MKEVDFKEAFNKFKPESFVFVNSISKDGRASGMVAGWQMKCSSDPPLYAVSLSKKGFTHNLIRESKEFVISVPNKDMEKDILYFGSNHGDVVDKFKDTKIGVVSGKFVKTPLLKNATINFECKLIKEVEAGDHIIFIGEILASHINEDKKVLLNLGKVDGKRVFKEYD
ncbi:flavin reductase family protein [Nanoarchaeota archaeon]